MSVAAVLAGDARSHIACARVEAFAPTIPDGSVNLLWLDPPYFRVVDEAWDRAWKTEADFLAWLSVVVREAARVLAPNGSLYLFASAQMGARVECIAAESLRVLNSITWAKSNAEYAPGDPRASALKVRDASTARAWVAFSERVVFAERRTSAVSAVGDAIREARENAGLSANDLSVLIGRVSSSDATRGTGLVRLWETDAPGSCVPAEGEFMRALRACGDHRSEGELRAEYLRRLRPFAAPASLADVWTYAPPHADAMRHPCEKPAAMLRDVVLASSRPGDVVCEFFGGSFRMAETALSLGRRYIGCDADPHWAAVGVERARAAERGTLAMVPAREAKPVDARQPSLFAAVSS